jgi:CCCH-type zinc finger/RNA-binding, Nab2-type zinc finger
MQRFSSPAFIVTVSVFTAPMSLAETPQRPICKYYLQNNCTRGKACTYSHQQDRPIHSSTISSKVVCVHHQKGMCRFGSQCRQLHDPAEHDVQGPAAKLGNEFGLHTGPNPSTFKPCKFFEQGNCAKGPACSFPHISLDTKAHTNPFPAPFKHPHSSRVNFAAKTGDTQITHSMKPSLPCKFFGRGECMRGAGCQFLHSPEKPLPSLSRSGLHSDLQGTDVSNFCLIYIRLLTLRFHRHHY